MGWHIEFAFSLSDDTTQFIEREVEARDRPTAERLAGEALERLRQHVPAGRVVSVKTTVTEAS